MLKSDDPEYYSNSDDLTYDSFVAGMSRTNSVLASKEKSSEDKAMRSHISRDKSRFFENRIKDNSSILDKVVKSISQVENRLNNLLLESNDDNAGNAAQMNGTRAASKTKYVDDGQIPSTSSQSTERVATKMPKVQRVKVTESKSTPKSESIVYFKKSSTSMTKGQAQKLLAQMMLGLDHIKEDSSIQWGTNK